MNKCEPGDLLIEVLSSQLGAFSISDFILKIVTSRSEDRVQCVSIYSRTANVKLSPFIRSDWFLGDVLVSCSL